MFINWNSDYTHPFDIDGTAYAIAWHRTVDDREEVKRGQLYNLDGKPWN